MIVARSYVSTLTGGPAIRVMRLRTTVRTIFPLAISTATALSFRKVSP